MQRYAVDALKVDPSFVGDSEADHERGAPLLSAIVGIGRSLNYRVMATGVETEAQLAFLEAAECREAQGYLFSHPVGADEIAELMTAPVRQFAPS